jgi:hypothetical protein
VRQAILIKTLQQTHKLRDVSRRLDAARGRRGRLRRPRPVNLSWALALAACLLLCGVQSSIAAVTGTPIAQLPNVALQLTSYGGYVIFSQLDASGKWQLMAWHHGSISRLAVPERTIPFDANAGPAANGEPTVVFSKCTREPPAESASPELQAQPPDWASAAGCHIYELALPNGTPSLVRGVYAPRASDSTPAVWKGDIAFARIRGGSRVPTLYVWGHANRRLRSVGGGPSACPALSVTFDPGFCKHAHAHLSAWVDEMSLDSHALAYQWRLPENSEEPFGSPYAEIRIDPLRDGRQVAPSQNVFFTIPGGACNGEQGGSPDVVGGSVLYSWHYSVCENPTKPVSAIGSYAIATRRHSDARVSPGVGVAVVQDHGTTYWIRDTWKNASLCHFGQGTCEGQDYYVATCAPAVSTCTLMQTNNLTSELKP